METSNNLFEDFLWFLRLCSALVDFWILEFLLWKWLLLVFVVIGGVLFTIIMIICLGFYVYKCKNFFYCTFHYKLGLRICVLYQMFSFVGFSFKVLYESQIFRFKDWRFFMFCSSLRCLTWRFPYHNFSFINFQF